MEKFLTLWMIIMLWAEEKSADFGASIWTNKIFFKSELFRRLLGSFIKLKTNANPKTVGTLSILKCWPRYLKWTRPMKYERCCCVQWALEKLLSFFLSRSKQSILLKRFNNPQFVYTTSHIIQSYKISLHYIYQHFSRPLKGKEHESHKGFEREESFSQFCENCLG